MEEKNPIQKLDEVLNFLNKNHEHQHAVISVKEGLSIKLDESIIGMILDKIVRDGYAEMRNVPYEKPIIKGDTIKISEYTYSITFEGQLFLQKGGYGQQESDNILHRANLETLESIRRRNEKLLSRGTIWLAVLTGALVVTEILVHWCELKHFFGC